ncbi:MAG TPA: MraY family glycosyltransferase [Planctomycetota bacterium]|nr:MraY family glycosyltransferase [Planctomycetota bacterium]
MIVTYFFLTSFLAMVVFTPWAIRRGHRHRILDFPGPRKTHSVPTPVTGGWALFAALTGVLGGHLLAGCLLQGSPLLDALPGDLGEAASQAPSAAARLIPLYAGATVLFLLGALDDARGLSVRTRLAVQILVSGSLTTLGFHPLPEALPTWLSIPFSILWIVGITNAFNLIDGLDGLAGGVALAATACLFALACLDGRTGDALLLAVLAGIELGFLRYNRRPARIFLGSSGSLLLGYLLAVAAGRTAASSSEPMSLLVPLLILAVPIYDTASVVFIRLREGRPVTVGDRSHFHHRLLKMGWDPAQTVSFISTVAALTGLAAVALSRLESPTPADFAFAAFAAGLPFMAERAAARASSLPWRPGFLTPSRRWSAKPPETWERIP